MTDRPKNCHVPQFGQPLVPLILGCSPPPPGQHYILRHCIKCVRIPAFFCWRQHKQPKTWFQCSAMVYSCLWKKPPQCEGRPAGCTTTLRSCEGTGVPSSEQYPPNASTNVPTLKFKVQTSYFWCTQCVPARPQWSFSCCPRPQENGRSYLCVLFEPIASPKWLWKA